jgi:copper oxidase (laccase) domain-containing protein
VRSARLVAWLGPAIGPGFGSAAVKLSGRDPGAARRAAQGTAADLPALAPRLAASGVGAVYGGNLCTWSDPARFYSYRRDGATGRMAALAWLA